MPGPGARATHTEAHMHDTARTGPAGSLVQSLTVPGQAEEVPRARAFIAGTLAAWGLPTETASLLGSELVANSVQHSNSRWPDGAITVTVAATPAEILVEVTDNGGGGTPLLCHGSDPCAENGRGLILVATLSARWGYRRARGDLTTWFKIPAESGHSTSLTGVSLERDRCMPAHPAEPAAQTFRTVDGLDADLFNLSHYPVRAVCRVCGGPIEADCFLLPFEHVTADLA